MRFYYRFFISLMLFCCGVTYSKDFGDKFNGKVVKGDRNALFLIENGARRQFPDFFTFDKMGYNASSVMKIKDHLLTKIPMGPMIIALPQPAAFRADDYMYHEQCNDPDKMVGAALLFFISLFTLRVRVQKHELSQLIIVHHNSS